MKILVVNAGSSSLKYQLIDMDGEKELAKGLVERIGIEGSKLKHSAGEKKTEIYQIAVLHFSESIGRKEEQMLAGILEEIVRSYHMGTLFVPRRRDMFLVFGYDPTLTETERIEKLQGNLRVLRKNVQQYSERKALSAPRRITHMI